MESGSSDRVGTLSDMLSNIVLSVARQNVIFRSPALFLAVLRSGSFSCASLPALCFLSVSALYPIAPMLSDRVRIMVRAATRKKESEVES